MRGVLAFDVAVIAVVVDPGVPSSERYRYECVNARS
jgi:hypothetical protein